MKRIFILTFFTVIMVFLTACNNVNKSAYNSNSGGSFFQSDTQTSSDVYKEKINSSSVNESTASTLAQHIHQFEAATCTTPKACFICNTTEGVALGHSWSDANCIGPKTCSVCGIAVDEKAPHSFVNGVCTYCGERDIDFNYTPLNSGGWISNIIDGGALYQFNLVIASGSEAYITYNSYEALSDVAEYDSEALYVYEGVRYIKTSAGDSNTIQVTEEGARIDAFSIGGEKLSLERVSDAVMIVNEVSESFLGYENILRAGLEFRLEITG